MKTSDAIRLRRSIRRYKSGVQMPRKDIEMILEAAMMAPSAVNSRPWEFIVAESKEKRNEIADAHPYAQMVRDASVAVVVCGRPDLVRKDMPEFWPQDCGAAIENMLLQAVELGYGGVWCGVYPNQERVQEIRRVVSANGVPLAVVALGVPDEQPDARGFFDPERVTYI